MHQLIGGPLDGLEIDQSAVGANGDCRLGLRFKSYDMDRETRKNYWLADPDPDPLATVLYRRGEDGKMRHVRTRL